MSLWPKRAGIELTWFPPIREQYLGGSQPMRVLHIYQLPFLGTETSFTPWFLAECNISRQRLAESWVGHGREGHYPVWVEQALADLTSWRTSWQEQRMRLSHNYQYGASTCTCHEMCLWNSKDRYSPLWLLVWRDYETEMEMEMVTYHY